MAYTKLYIYGNSKVLKFLRGNFYGNFIAAIGGRPMSRFLAYVSGINI